MPSVRKANSADVLYLSDRLRAEDVAEVKAASNHTPFQALIEGLEDSDECLTLVSDTGTPVAMFGVAPIEGLPDFGAVWFLSTPELPQMARYFLRETKGHLKRFLRRYSRIGNVVDCRNGTHIRYLKWAGFSFGTIFKAYGYEGLPFLYFEMSRNKGDLCVDPQLS